MPLQGGQRLGRHPGGRARGGWRGLWSSGPSSRPGSPLILQPCDQPPAMPQTRQPGWDPTEEGRQGCPPPRMSGWPSYSPLWPLPYFINESQDAQWAVGTQCGHWSCSHSPSRLRPRDRKGTHVGSVPAPLSINSCFLSLVGAGCETHTSQEVCSQQWLVTAAQSLLIGASFLQVPMAISRFLCAQTQEPPFNQRNPIQKA